MALAAKGLHQAPGYTAATAARAASPGLALKTLFLHLQVVLSKCSSLEHNHMYPPGGLDPTSVLQAEQNKISVIPPACF